MEKPKPKKKNAYDGVVVIRKPIKGRKPEVRL